MATVTGARGGHWGRLAIGGACRLPAGALGADALALANTRRARADR